MTVLVRYQPESLNRETYEKVNEALGKQGEQQPPDPLRIHVLFGDEPNLRVSEIWDSEDAWREWYDSTLKGAFEEAGFEVPEPEVVTVRELWGSAVKR